MIKETIVSLINEQSQIKWEIISQSDLQGANAGFAVETNTVYLAEEFLIENEGNSDAISLVLLEEIGHYFDSQLNAEDSLGDEGELFANLVLDKDLDIKELERLKAEEDQIIIHFDGEDFSIEQNSSSRPDLVISDATAPNSAIIGAEIPISFILTNQGDGDNNARSVVKVYFSNDTELDDSDSLIDSNNFYSLSSGASQTVNINETVPNLEIREQYLLFVSEVSSDNNILESNKNNNLLAVPIQIIGGPDLIITEATTLR